MTSTSAHGATTPTGAGRPASPVRRRGRPRLAVLLAVCFTVWLSAVPGTASAAGVTPFVDCYQTNSDGTVTVVLGYTNSYGRATAIPLGTRNVMSPSKFQGSQPTQYLPGTRRGAFSVQLTQSDLSSDPRWLLDGNSLNYSTASSAAECSPSTPLPALGNGAGIAVVLIAGAAFGVLFVRRLIRRTAAAA